MVLACLALCTMVNSMSRKLLLFFIVVPLMWDTTRASGPANQGSDFLLEQKQLRDAVLGRPSKGFFKEEGLDVELIQVNPRLGAIAVLNGDLDFTTTFGTTLRSILQGGFPVKFVFVSVKKSEHSLIVRPEIKEIKGLVNKRFGVATLLGSDQRAGEEMMRAKGFNPALQDYPVGGFAGAHASHSGWNRGRHRHRPAAGSAAENGGLYHFGRSAGRRDRASDLWIGRDQPNAARKSSAGQKNFARDAQIAQIRF